MQGHKDAEMWGHRDAGIQDVRTQMQGCGATVLRSLWHLGMAEGHPSAWSIPITVVTPGLGTTHWACPKRHRSLFLPCLCLQNPVAHGQVQADPGGIPGIPGRAWPWELLFPARPLVTNLPGWL